MSNASRMSAHPVAYWRTLFSLTFLAAYFYVLIEWLFLVTRRSYADYLEGTQKLDLFFVSSALLTGFVLLLLGFLYLLGRLPVLRSQQQRLVQLAGLIPVFILTLLALIVLDNFTYTMLSVGVVSTTGVGRLLYGLGFVAVLVVFYRALLRDLPGYSRRIERQRWGRWLVPSLLLVLLAPLLFTLLSNERGPGWQGRPQSVPIDPPFNILYITSDGLQASNMGIYGYERDTTPFLSQLAPEMLLVENAFTNSGRTAGSITSAMTGAYPARTRVLHIPDILRGQAASQHLPGILHRAGYYTAQFGITYYVDAYARNVVQGFDEVNGRHVPVDSFWNQAAGYFPVDLTYFVTYFVRNTLYRLTDRFGHIFFIELMNNPAERLKLDGLHDADLHVNDLLTMLEGSEGPFYVHLHLVNTHGPKYYLERQVYSAGKPLDDQVDWDTDLYDDSILGFDRLVASLVEVIKRKGMYERTILVIGSDHGQQWSLTERIPLLIRFPHGEHAGRVAANAQIIDIPATLLDYLGQPVPDWMDGRSLLQVQDPQRPIFVAYTWAPRNDVEFVERLVSPPSPPFYQFGVFSVIHCRRWYTLTLRTGEFTSGLVEGSTAACPAAESENPTQARSWILDHLHSNGFDVSSLRAP